MFSTVYIFITYLTTKVTHTHAYSKMTLSTYATSYFWSMMHRVYTNTINQSNMFFECKKSKKKLDSLPALVSFKLSNRSKNIYLKVDFIFFELRLRSLNFKTLCAAYRTPYTWYIENTKYAHKTHTAHIINSHTQHTHNIHQIFPQKHTQHTK